MHRRCHHSQSRCLSRMSWIKRRQHFGASILQVKCWDHDCSGHAVTVCIACHPESTATTSMCSSRGTATTYSSVLAAATPMYSSQGCITTTTGRTIKKTQSIQGFCVRTNSITSVKIRLSMPRRQRGTAIIPARRLNRRGQKRSRKTRPDTQDHMTRPATQTAVFNVPNTRQMLLRRSKLLYLTTVSACASCQKGA